LVEGQHRALVDEIIDTGRYLLATVQRIRNEALEPKAKLKACGAFFIGRV
jgi:orotate phosphoribosyltransferase-like protein